ncbi:hypothetical protein JKP88DRAFT_274691 [Tribonema minus]|uniref:DUF5710 domain-containing protein n=1 Tax=Tribonema minus TaxID=303371 RepID=A0A835ZIG3_9STRA|nr:hypothetical protein JKP88DRAFT_274691 [Tribonema minus]
MSTEGDVQLEVGLWGEGDEQRLVGPLEARALGGSGKCPCCTREIICVLPKAKANHMRHVHDDDAPPCNPTAKAITSGLGETFCHREGKRFIQENIGRLVFQKICACCITMAARRFQDHVVRLEETVFCDDKKYIVDVGLHHPDTDELVAVVEIKKSHASCPVKLGALEKMLGYENVFELDASALVENYIREVASKSDGEVIAVHSASVVCPACMVQLVCGDCEKTFSKYQTKSREGGGVCCNDCWSRKAAADKPPVICQYAPPQRLTIPANFRMDLAPITCPADNENLKGYGYDPLLKRRWCPTFFKAYKMRNFITDEDDLAYLDAVTGPRIWLDVPYSEEEREDAKAKGAVWDKKAKGWYTFKRYAERLEDYALVQPTPKRQRRF